MEKKTSIRPYNPKNRLLNKNDVQNILKRYQVFNNINDLSVFQRAFVHESYSIPYIRHVMERDEVSLDPCPDGIVPLQSESYERLEFLGDRVIELVMADYVYNRYPDQDEGFLSRIKVSLVNGIMLSHFARTIGLGKFLLCSKTQEDREQLRLRDHVLEDVFEAFIGAIFLDFNGDKPGQLAPYLSGLGFHVAQKFLINLLEDENTEVDMTELILEDGNIKDQLVRYYRRAHQTTLTFRTVRTEGHGLDKVFVVQVIDDKTKKIIGEGEASSEKQGHHEAARNILVQLKLMS